MRRVCRNLGRNQKPNHINVHVQEPWQELAQAFAYQQPPLASLASPIQVRFNSSFWQPWSYFLCSDNNYFNLFYPEFRHRKILLRWGVQQIFDIICVLMMQRALSEALCRSAAGMGSGDATDQYVNLNQLLLFETWMYFYFLSSEIPAILLREVYDPRFMTEGCIFVMQVCQRLVRPNNN